MKTSAILVTTLLMTGLLASASQEAKPEQQFLAFGAIGKPGPHEFVEGLNMIRVINLLGGVGPAASLNNTQIFRRKAGGGFDAIPVKLGQLIRQADMEQNVPLQAGDILYIPFEKEALAGAERRIGERK